MLALLVAGKVLAILIKSYIFVVLYIAGECTSGFAPLMLTDPGTPIDHTLQVLIPSLHFTDSGHITAFHLAGICGGGEPSVPAGDYINTTQGCINILQVWRPLMSGGNRFSIAANFTANLSVTYNTPVSVSVAVDEPIPFSSGDVLGFTLGPNAGFYFQIYATSTARRTHIYRIYNSSTPQLRATGNNKVGASPLISVEGRHITCYVFRVLICLILLVVLCCLGLQCYGHMKGSMFVTTYVITDKSE